MLAGAAFLLAASAVVLALSFSRLTGIGLVGCGAGSPCAQAAASPWGRVPLLDWPVSHIGAAYFLALLVAWITCRGRSTPSLRAVTRIAWPKNVLVNVNFPDVPPDKVKGVKVARQGRHKIGDQLVENIDPRGRPYYWIGAMRLEDPTRSGTDIAMVNQGYISITPLYLDLTHRPTMNRLAEALK